MKVLTIAATCLFFNILSYGERVDVENRRSEMPAFARSSRRVCVPTLGFERGPGGEWKDLRVAWRLAEC
jgi:hypothetical protein